MRHHSGIPRLCNNAAKTSLQLSRRELLAFGAFLLRPKAFAAEAQQYDILGLRLNMTAAEAQQILAQRLHAKPKQEGYRITAGHPQYAPNRPYTSAISFANPSDRLRRSREVTHQYFRELDHLA